MVVVGCGAMGSRHAEVVARDPRWELLLVDIVPERAHALAERTGGRAVRRIPEQVVAAIVATPTTTHREVAEPLLERGVWCLVEKPLADTVASARALAGGRCAVGHVERFNPAVRAAGRLRPTAVEGRRVAPPTGRGLDVDVVFDLMIHDLDLVLQWARPGDRVAAVEASGDEDTATVALRTEGGLTARLLASRVATTRERQLVAYHEGPPTTLDLLGGRAWRGADELRAEDPRDALTCQWASFSARAEGRATDGADSGLPAVELAHRVREAIGMRPAGEADIVGG